MIQFVRRIRYAIPVIIMLAVCALNPAVQSAKGISVQTRDGQMASANSAAAAPSGSEAKVASPSSTWIVKWSGEPAADFWCESELVDHHESMSVWVVRPQQGVDIEQWEARWSADPAVVYLQPNQKVELLAAPNDTYYARQSYLQQIYAPDAWEMVRQNPTMVIALIDTGVDLDHPDLKDNLVAGINLVSPELTPEDDHGHGTNVAGVVAAIGNNGVGISGVSWRSKIMPIKALEASGQGDEDKLGEGIRYAVDQGAKIIVLSVGLHRYSPFLQEVADYAEQKGVLLISATGNEGREVKFPAAYPTVLAVGGVGVDNRVMLESNFGSEIDLVAPWEVYTTALGGFYEYNQGTSMAAPQAAGAAALIWAQYPEMKPFEVRNLLRQTAQDIETAGWDVYSGYGLLRIDRALTEPYRVDMYEPNNQAGEAKRLPLDAMIYGELTTGADDDWFYMIPQYDGHVRFTLLAARESADALPKVKLTHDAGDNAEKKEYADILNHPPLVPVKAGRSQLVIELEDQASTAVFPYKLKSQFEIYADPFEDNDRQFKAYTLPVPQASVTGTFHQLNDQDWYSILVDKSGSLQLTVIPDNSRMDVAVMVQKTGEKAFIMDQHAEGGSETISAYDLMPGRYYILVSNVISDNAYPVRGEYELRLQVTPKLIDPNEPNDKSYQATNIVDRTEYTGLIDQSSDNDWFTFKLDADSYVSIRLQDIPNDKLMLMTLYDNRQTQLALNINSQGVTELTMDMELKTGTYFIKLGANKPFVDKLYRLSVQMDELVVGFRDVKGHWAERAIADMAKAGFVQGYGDYTFRPERNVTRAEAVVMLSRAFGFSGNAQAADVSVFTDVDDEHWALPAIRAAVDEGMISGYDDGTFRPNQPISRAELSVMIARGLGLVATLPTSSPFADVSRGHWAAGWLSLLVEQGIVNGYADGSFRPDAPASRAEMTVLTAKVAGR